MSISYRPAEPADAGDILRCMKRIGGESHNLTFGAEGLPFTVEQEEALLSKMAANPRAALFLALESGEIVGSVTIRAQSRERMAHRWELGITVLRSHWGRGVGSGLMELAIAFARENGGEVISLEVLTDNHRAKALYRKFGFETFGVYRKFFRIDGEYFDAEYMNLYL